MSSRLASTPPNHPPAIEAHRGDSARAPENTLPAFDAALSLNVPWIELDVHPARDGTLMVIHDATIDRTTNGTGAVRDLTAAQLRCCDAGSWFSPAFAGTPIPRLADVLERVAPTETRLNVEIKASPSGHDVPKMLVALLRRFGRDRRSMVSSFDLAPLLAVRRLAPDIPLALIGKGDAILEAALAHHLPWIHAQHQTLDESLAARAHARGLRIMVWTVDEPAALPHWTLLGVDKVCTNRPADMLAATRRRPGLRPPPRPAREDRGPRRCWRQGA